MINFELVRTSLSPGLLDDLVGLLPSMLSENDDRPAREQFNTGYAYSGGWVPFEGFEMSENMGLVYPGDPPMDPVAKAVLRDEIILIYPHAWVAIVQPDKTFEICRMD